MANPAKFLAGLSDLVDFIMAALHVVCLQLKVMKLVLTCRCQLDQTEVTRRMTSCDYKLFIYASSLVYISVIVGLFDLVVDDKPIII